MSCSEKLAELFDGESRVAHNTTHRKGVDGIVSRDSEDALSVGRHGVLAFANNAEPGPLQGANGVEMIDAGISPTLNRYLDLTDLGAARQVLVGGEVFTNRVRNARDRVGLCGALCGALRPAPRQSWDSNAVPFFVVM